MSLAISRDRADWLERRRRGIGASDAPAILGFSPFAGPREIYLSKLGRLPEAEESEAMRWGTLLEPLIAQEYTRRTGHAVVEQQVFRAAADVPYLLATLDGVTDAGHLLEIKTTSAWKGGDLGEEETDDLPEHWLIQAHQQMFVAEAARVDFAVLVGGQQLKVFTVHRDENLIAGMLPRLAEFWECVRRQTPPAELHRADRKLMHLIYPGCEGVVELTADDTRAVDLYVAMGKQSKDLEDARSLCKAAILDRLGNAAVGYLPDGRAVTRRIVEVGEQVVTRKAYSYVDLRVKKARGT